METTTTTLTSVETMELRMPGFAGPFYTMEPRPVCRNAHISDYLEVFSENFETGERIIWYNNGNILMTKADGTTKKWYARPTLKDAVQMVANSRSYTQFKSTGEVIQVLNDNIPWYWGVQNVEINAFEMTDVIYENYEDNEDDCGCGNNIRCCGWYPFYEDY
jgi:hypothetical protein